MSIPQKISTALAAFALVSIIAACSTNKNMQNEIQDNKATTFTQSADSKNPLISKTLAYIKERGINNLPTERVNIQGDDIILNGVVDCQLRTQENAPLEAHKNYIDLQVIIEGVEKFGLKNVVECREIKKPYNPEKDIVFFCDSYTQLETVSAGQFIILKPDTAHAPLIGSGQVKKCVFKIKAQ